MGMNPWVSISGGYPAGSLVFYSGAGYISNIDNNTDTPGASGVTSWNKLFTESGLVLDASYEERFASIESTIEAILSRLSSLEDRVTALEGGTPTPGTSVSMLQSNTYLYATSGGAGSTQWHGVARRSGYSQAPYKSSAFSSPYTYFSSSTANVGWAIVYKYTGFKGTKADAYQTPTNNCLYTSAFMSDASTASTSHMMGIGGNVTFSAVSWIDSYSYTDILYGTGTTISDYYVWSFDSSIKRATISDTSKYYVVGCRYNTSTSKHMYLNTSSSTVPSTFTDWTSTTKSLPSGETSDSFYLIGGSPIGICKIVYFNFDTNATAEFTPTVDTSAATPMWYFKSGTTTLVSGELGKAFSEP